MMIVTINKDPRPPTDDCCSNAASMEGSSAEGGSPIVSARRVLCRSAALLLTVLLVAQLMSSTIVERAHHHRPRVMFEALGGPPMGDGDELQPGHARKMINSRPPEFVGCGNWQEDYMELHRRILSGELPPRYLVSVGVQAGLADRLTGIITEFYMALLTGRAFQLTVGNQSLVELNAAFDAPFVNWTRHDDPPELTDPWTLSYKGKREYDSTRVNTSRYAGIYMINRLDESMFASASLLADPKWHPTVETLFIASNRGRTFGLFDNPNHRKQLLDLGLRPETAFACAFRFLFAPNEAVKHEMAQTATQLNTTDKGVMRIGIQVRSGDKVLRYGATGKEGQMDVGAFDVYWRCAEKIESLFKPVGTTQVVWHVISDALRVRQTALERYNNTRTVVTKLQVYRHSNCLGDCRQHYRNQDCISYCQAGSAGQELVHAAADMLTFASNDFFVITQNSGFGKLPVWLSMRSRSAYQVRRGQKFTCGPKDYASLESMSHGWSGV